MRAETLREELIAAALSAGLADADRRDLLLDGLPAAVKAALPIRQRPADQLRSDVSALLGFPAADEAAAPVLVWLRNAIALVGHAAGAEIFHRAHLALAPVHRAPGDLTVYLVNRRHALTLAARCRAGWTVQVLLDEAIDRHLLPRFEDHDPERPGCDVTRFVYRLEANGVPLDPRATVAASGLVDGAPLTLVVGRIRYLDDPDLREFRPAPLDDDEAAAEAEVAWQAAADRAMGRG